MKNIGILLIVAGIVMLIIRGFNYTEKEKVMDLGKIEITKEEEKAVTWPLYAGGVAIVAGIVLVFMTKKDK